MFLLSAVLCFFYCLNMDIELIKLFNCALETEPVTDFERINAMALQRGYIVHPAVCNSSVEQFLGEQTINYNATFYKSFQQVVSKSREQLLWDQLLHYFTTYGTDFSCGNGFVPNDGSTELLPYSRYKSIMPISVKDLARKCLDTVCSGIALKQSTIRTCCDFLLDNMTKEEIDVDAIKNREAQTYICDKLSIAPHDKFALLRYIIYKTTGSTLIIKNNTLIREILTTEHPYDFRTLDEQQLKSLASIFLRFKPLFLAFKKHLDYNKLLRQEVLSVSLNATIINRLRRLAKQEHKPMPQLFWSQVLQPNDLREVEKHLHEITLFKVVALMQACKERLLELQETENDRLFVIRNQKLWLRHQSNADNPTFKKYLTDLYALLENYLVSQLRRKACPVRYPEGYRLSLPATEKSFVGNMPFGTQYELDNDNFIGIYWRQEWGTRDFDLSIIDQSGHKIGWNADFYDENHAIIFSGDMTNADPEASEVMCFSKGSPDAMIYVNRFNGLAGSKYKMYFGKETIRQLTKNYMVNPDSVCLTVDMESSDDKQQTIGLVFDNTVTLMQFTFGKGRVSYNRQDILNCMRRKAQCFVDVRTILQKAGFTDTTTQEIEQQEQLLDLTNIDKSTLIQLLS